MRLWRDYPLADLTPGRIESDLGQSAEEEEWMPATYNRYRALLSGVFSLAMRNGKATANPVSETQKREENNERVRFWSDDEQAHVMAEARTATPEIEAQILVALHSGMRRSEQYVTRDCPDGGLKWSYIDFQNRLITIPRSKHGKTRHIRMNSLLLEALRALKRSADSPYVFPGEPPDKLFTEVCQRAGVDDFTWHCLRHTFASRFVMAGVDIRTVQELMGHKTIQMTMRYAHLAPEHEADAVERLVPGNPRLPKLTSLLAP
ncbi:MAG TPA: site-specific integrase [Terriglobia bacterium]|nr:site-specific integrase [Terriglobia bacterium]